MERLCWHGLTLIPTWISRLSMLGLYWEHVNKGGSWCEIITSPNTRKHLTSLWIHHVLIQVLSVSEMLVRKCYHLRLSWSEKKSWQEVNEYVYVKSNVVLMWKVEQVYKFTGTPITPVIHIQTILGEQNYCACPVRTVIGVYMQNFKMWSLQLKLHFCTILRRTAILTQVPWHTDTGIPLSEL